MSIIIIIHTKFYPLKPFLKAQRHSFIGYMVIIGMYIQLDSPNSYESGIEISDQFNIYQH